MSRITIEYRVTSGNVSENPIAAQAYLDSHEEELTTLKNALRIAGCGNYINYETGEAGIAFPIMGQAVTKLYIRSTEGKGAIRLTYRSEQLPNSMLRPQNVEVQFDHLVCAYAYMLIEDWTYRSQSDD